MKNNRLLFNGLLVFGWISILTSCTSNKNIPYFQDAGYTKQAQKVINSYQPVIQSDDILAISISSLNPEATVLFNTKATNSSTNTLDQRQIDGYLVDKNGFVDMPVIGLMKLGGLTSDAASNTIKAKLTNYLKEPSVSVRFLNFKVSVLGEVARPGVYPITSESVTLAEALGLAGDITIYGVRENVLLIREENGSRQFARINMNSSDVFATPYYYLHKGDVIYVEPNQRKYTSSESNKPYQILAVLIGFLNVAAIVALNKN
ncbi:polysaccharide biosynthesis/export family protein [Solitalea koreensis]|uniref:Polysaccharide export outer membrane protein n=1 Tax=Solitalea koreensis TaxID=543615 RepID=A0A521ANY9_9SPHI|nr:polysaccharide biosynthesis/export family protein [Solitalea koreensis]SMO36526.1 polysaccharide export outer membrane protein [Solitalea koreensis]